MGRLSREKQQSIEEMAGEVMDIVGRVAVRRLVQVTELVHDDMIVPLRNALKECQTLTPSLLTGEQAIERLKEINQHVYKVLETK